MKRRTLRHLSLSVEGALTNPENWVDCITVDGKVLTTALEVKAFLEECLALGYELLPMASDCEGFDYKTGCPGHVIEEEE